MLKINFQKMSKKILSSSWNYKNLAVIFSATVLITVSVAILHFPVQAGNLNPSSAPGSTMHTLDDIYNVLQTITTSIVCSSDMVKVGDFCIDKYEASVWSSSTAGTQYGASSDNYPCNDNGNDCPKAAAHPIYARSTSGVTPSAYITWFQAAQACANVEKHLCTDPEWQVAAAGTPDPGTGTPPNCNVSGSGPTTTGAGTNCLSSWGTENMVGSLWEWTADQYGRGTNTTANNAAYGSDYQYYTAPTAYQGGGANMNAAAIRGGYWNNGSNAGVFAVSLADAPSLSDTTVGFRCCR
jgi:formylglycine-generating enzyme required for sulfatase activity